MREKEITKVVLDIGNHSVKLLMGTMNSTCDKISVKEYIKLRSKGIKKSNIEDPEALLGVLSKGLTELENRTEEKIEKLSLALGGNGVTSATRNVKITFPEKEVTEEDVEELYRQAKRKVFGAREDTNFRVLYKEIYNIRVNSARIVRQPIGIMAKELQADIHIVYVKEEYAEKYIELVNRLGLEVEGVYLSSYLSAKGTLDEESKKMGVAHVDIGYGSTDIILFKNYKVLYTKTMPIGEMHYISDISHMLGVSKEDAEKIIQKFKNKECENDNTIRYQGKRISVRDMRDLIQARTGDIVDFITSTIESSGYTGYLVKGVVLTGGALGIEGLAEQVMKSGYLVRKEFPIEVKGMENPHYSDAVIIGAFFEDMEKEYRDYIEEKNKQAIKEEEKTVTEDDIDELMEESDAPKKQSFIKKILSFF